MIKMNFWVKIHLDFDLFFALWESSPTFPIEPSLRGTQIEMEYVLRV